MSNLKSLIKSFCFLLNHVNFFSIATILTITTLFVVLFFIYKHTKLKTLNTRLALEQLQSKKQILDAFASKRNKIGEDIICTCKLEWWTIIRLSISIYAESNQILIMKAKKVRIYKGYLYSNTF